MKRRNLGHNEIDQIVGKTEQEEKTLYLIKWKSELRLSNTWEPGQHFPHRSDFNRCLRKFEASLKGSPYQSDVGQKKVIGSSSRPGWKLSTIDQNYMNELEKRSQLEEEDCDDSGHSKEERSSPCKKKFHPIMRYLNYQNKKKIQNPVVNPFAKKKKKGYEKGKEEPKNFKNFQQSERSGRIRDFIRTQNIKSRKIRKKMEQEKRNLLMSRNLEKPEAGDDEDIVYKNCLDMIEGISGSRNKFIRKIRNTPKLNNSQTFQIVSQQKASKSTPPP